MLVIESVDKDGLSKFLSKLLNAWRGFLGSSDEPMINMICAFREMVWRVILFPRVKHRPDVYFKEGEERILMSPAAVDMGGLIITPLEKDFQRLDAGMIESIFSEVSLDEKKMNKIVAGL
ncbi:MAG TPA: hypothetical protein VI704_02595 [Bacteroidota bacterium]|nr:hypothetical protein [Bacteroidota bacterium]